MAAHRPVRQGRPIKREATYIFEGSLAGVDADASTFTVAVEEGNKAARTYLGEQTFTIDDGYTKAEVDEVDVLDLADLVGQQVRVQNKASTPVKILVSRRVSAVTAKVGDKAPST